MILNLISNISFLNFRQFLVPCSFAQKSTPCFYQKWKVSKKNLALNQEHKNQEHISLHSQVGQVWILFRKKMLSSSPSRPLPVPYPSYTRPIPVPYLSLTCLASLGLIKGRGQTLYLIFLYNRLRQLYNRLRHPPLNFSKTIRSHREPLCIPEIFHATHVSLTPPPHLNNPLIYPLPIWSP